MASLIGKDRKEHFEALQVQKRRADKINQSCFIWVCGIALEAVITLIIGIGSGNSDNLICDLRIHRLLQAKPAAEHCRCRSVPCRIYHFKTV